MRLDHLLSKERISTGCFTVESSREPWGCGKEERKQRGGEDGRFLVAMRPGDTPVPIPNTMVKTRTADGTILETIWESRWLPDYMGL